MQPSRERRQHMKAPRIASVSILLIVLCALVLQACQGCDRTSEPARESSGDGGVVMLYNTLEGGKKQGVRIRDTVPAVLLRDDAGSPPSE